MRDRRGGARGTREPATGPRAGRPRAGRPLRPPLGLLALLLALLPGLLLVGCAARGGARGAGPGPRAIDLPPIPEVDGALRIRVVYPDSLARIAVRDSNFLFGSVGSGRAVLAVNGHRVEVEPNGTFLAWLPVPEPAAGDTAAYRLVASRDGRADTAVHRVLLPGGAPPPGDRVRAAEGSHVWAARSSLRSPERWAPPDEEVPISVVGAPGLEVWLERPERPERTRPGRSPGAGAAGTRAAGAAGTEGAASGRTVDGGSRIPLPETDEGRYRVALAAGRLERLSAPGPSDTLRLRVVLTDGADTLRAPYRLPLRVLDPERLPVLELRAAPDTVHGRPEVVAGRAAPYGSFAWRFPEGSRAVADGRIGDRVRLRLAPGLHAWVASEDVRPGPAGARVPETEVGPVRVEPLPDRLRVRIAAGGRRPVAVERPGSRSVAVVLYGALGGTERISYGPADPLLRSVEWRPLPGRRVRVTVRLAEPVWGHRLRWEAGTPGTLRLDLRRPPEIDPDRPLRGRRIAVDPGHPPLGATGPGGLTEAEANLAVARRLVARLRSAGAEPVLLREGSGPVGLYERREKAVAAGAELFVSIHNNALPDGVRPFGREGTSTYYFHPHARDLARAVQRGMLRRMGLRDLGIYYGNLAVPRTSWMPSVLAEGAFMMFPRHEAALRTERYQEAYARGVLEGIRAFLAERAR